MRFFYLLYQLILLTIRLCLTVATAPALAMSVCCGIASANDAATSSPTAPADRWLLNLSPFTQHYHPKPVHEYVWLVGVEKIAPDNSLMGAAYFNNSFGQPSVYLYPFGQVYPKLWGIEKLTGKWSAGLLYGYVDPWEHKVPFNVNGFSPGFVPALSWQLGEGYEAQVSFPGGAGLMFHWLVPLSQTNRD